MNANLIARTDAINEILSSDHALFQVRIDSVLSGNGMKDALILHSDAINAGLIVYPTDGFWTSSDREITEKIEEMFAVNARNLKIDDYLEPSRIKQLIVPRAISAERIPDLQSQDIFYIKKLDLAFTFSIPIHSTWKGDEAAIRVTKSILARADIKMEEAMEYAEKNIHEAAVFEPLSGVLGELDPDAGTFETPLWMLSNKERVQGAGVLLSDSMLQEAANRLKTDTMYILPSSIHEVLCVGGDIGIDLYDLLQMVTDINTNEVDPDEKLTDNVYIFRNGRLESLI